MKILVIIPAYNEERNIRKTIQELKTHAPMTDYLVVNDCSTDETQRILNEMGAVYVSLPANLGIGGGVQTGYLYALDNDYDIAIQMDGDGQHDAGCIADLIEPIENGRADVVIGSRFVNKEGFQSSKMRRLGIGFLSGLIRLCCGVKILDVTSGYRAVNKKMIGIFAREYAQDYPEPEAIIASAMHEAKILEIPVIMHERQNGKSSISKIKSVYYMIKVSAAVLLYRLSFGKRRT